MRLSLSFAVYDPTQGGIAFDAPAHVLPSCQWSEPFGVGPPVQQRLQVHRVTIHDSLRIRARVRACRFNGQEPNEKTTCE